MIRTFFAFLPACYSHTRMDSERSPGWQAPDREAVVTEPMQRDLVALFGAIAREPAPEAQRGGLPRPDPERERRVGGCSLMVGQGNAWEPENLLARLVREATAARFCCTAPSFSWIDAFGDIASGAEPPIDVADRRSTARAAPSRPRDRRRGRPGS